MWLNHFAAHLKLTQHFQSAILQLFEKRLVFYLKYSFFSFFFFWVQLAFYDFKSYEDRKNDLSLI